MSDVNIKIDFDTDAVWGAANIGAVLGVNPRRAHYLLATEALRPAGARMVGGRWLASRRRLEAFIQGDTVDA